ncbi:hypothetical protein Tco_1402972 [Tanacetum coccineum]
MVGERRGWSLNDKAGLSGFWIPNRGNQRNEVLGVPQLSQTGSSIVQQHYPSLAADIHHQHAHCHDSKWQAWGGCQRFIHYKQHHHHQQSIIAISELRQSYGIFQRKNHANAESVATGAMRTRLLYPGGDEQS